MHELLRGIHTASSTARHGAVPRGTALIDYMQISDSIHTDSSAAQYCAAARTQIASRAIFTIYNML